MIGAGVVQEEKIKYVVGESDKCKSCAYEPPCALCSFFDKENLAVTPYFAARVGSIARNRALTQRREW